MQLPSAAGREVFCFATVRFAVLALPLAVTGGVFAQSATQSTAMPHRAARQRAERIRVLGPRGLRMAGPAALGLLALQLALELRAALVLQELVLALRPGHVFEVTSAPRGRLGKAYQIAS